MRSIIILVGVLAGGPAWADRAWRDECDRATLAHLRAGGEEHIARWLPALPGFRAARPERSTRHGDIVIASDPGEPDSAQFVSLGAGRAVFVWSERWQGRVSLFERTRGAWRRADAVELDGGAPEVVWTPPGMVVVDVRAVGADHQEHRLLGFRAAAGRLAAVLDTGPLLDAGPARLTADRLRLAYTVPLERFATAYLGKRRVVELTITADGDSLQQGRRSLTPWLDALEDYCRMRPSGKRAVRHLVVHPALVDLLPACDRAPPLYGVRVLPDRVVVDLVVHVPCDTEHTWETNDLKVTMAPRHGRWIVVAVDSPTCRIADALMSPCATPEEDGVRPCPLSAGPVVVAAGQLYPGAVAVDDDAVYWATDSRILRVPRVGGLYSVVAAVPGVTSLAARRGWVYFATLEGRFGRVPHAGGAPEPVPAWVDFSGYTGLGKALLATLGVRDVDASAGAVAWVDRQRVYVVSASARRDRHGPRHAHRPEPDTSSPSPVATSSP